MASATYRTAMYGIDALPTGTANGGPHFGDRLVPCEEPPKGRDGIVWLVDTPPGRRREARAPKSDAGADALGRVRLAALRYQVALLTLQRDMARSALDTLSLGIILADQTMQLVSANETAGLLLADPDSALALQSGRICARRQEDQVGLRRVVTDALLSPAAPGCGHLLLRSPDAAGRHLSLCVTPLPIPGPGACSQVSLYAMITVTPLEPAMDLARIAQQLFALTEAEAKFAAALAAGRSLAEAAAQQGVRISTARTHLARIFQKTGTRQQSQLAALLRGAELPVRGRDPGRRGGTHSGAGLLPDGPEMDSRERTIQDVPPSDRLNP